VTRTLAAAALALALVGCTHPIDVAVRAANGSREVGMIAHDAIEHVCVPAYRAATRETLPQVEARCDAASRAYRVYAASWSVAVVAIQRAQLGLASEADAVAAALAAGRAGADLSAAVQAVTR
jgi:hypothetical protein